MTLILRGQMKGKVPHFHTNTGEVRYTSLMSELEGGWVQGGRRAEAVVSGDSCSVRSEMLRCIASPGINLRAQLEGEVLSNEITRIS